MEQKVKVVKVNVSQEKIEEFNRAEINSTSLDSKCVDGGKHIPYKEYEAGNNYGVVRELCSVCNAWYFRRATPK